MYTFAVQSASYDMITDSRKVLHSTASYQDYRVLLKIMALATNVGRYLEPVGETDPGDFA